jgi:hypothetical protein
MLWLEEGAESLASLITCQLATQHILVELEDSLKSTLFSRPYLSSWTYWALPIYFEDNLTDNSGAYYHVMIKKIQVF